MGGLMTGYDLLRELQEMSQEELDLEVVASYWVDGDNSDSGGDTEKGIYSVKIGVKDCYNKTKYIILD